MHLPCRFAKLAAWAAFACLSLGAPRAWAQTVVWSGGGNRFTTGSNWVGGSAPGATDTAQFGPDGGNPLIYVNSTTVGGLEFLATRTGVYLLSYDDGVSTLTLTNGVTVASGPNVGFTSAMDLALPAGEHVFDVGGSTTLAVAGVISGAGHFSKTGTGTLVLTGANTYSYTGGLGYLNSTVVHAGTLVVDGGAINHGTNGDIWVGENSGDAGTLTLTNGGQASGYFGVLGNFSGSAGTATVTGSGSTWANSSGMGVGYQGNGTLNILNGGSVTVADIYSYIGYASTSTGAATIDGAGSTWTTAGAIDVGYAGIGTLTLANGGKINLNNGSGAVTLAATASGNGTLNIGAAAASPAAAGGIVNAATITTGSGTGTLQFNTTAASGSPYYLTRDGTSTGAAVTIAGATQLINNAGYNVLTGTNTHTGGTRVSGGTLEVSGAGSISHGAANTYVGYSNGDDANLLISGGADITDKQGQIGLASGSVGAVSVSGAGSTWTHTNYLYVGLAGLGSLDIAGGASVSSPNTSIGNNTGGTGSVYVSGSGSTLLNSDTLYVGSQGLGSLDITNGGNVTNVTGSVGNNAGGAGSVYIDTGGIWNNTGSLLVGNATTGSTTVYGASTVTAYNVIIGVTAGVYGSFVVADAGSSLTTTSNLVVGGSGSGNLSIINGANVVTGDTAGLGNSTGSTSLVTLSGTGSTWSIANSLVVGNSGAGDLVVIDGAELAVGAGAGPITLGASGGTGRLYLGVYDVEGGSDAGIVNAGSITTGSGLGFLYFESTNSTKFAPYYLTTNGTAGGAPVTVTGPTQVEHVYGYTVLTGANSYTGGTLISDGTLVAGVNGALGTGPVTVSGGALWLASGVSLSNPLTFTGGTLGGSGTIASAFTAGPGIHLAPGNSPGTLTFTSGLTLAGGGTLDFEVQSAAGPAGTGYDLLSISGAALNLTATSGSPFTLRIISLNPSGTAGAVSDFSSGNSYAWTIATSSAGITGFAANAFVVDTSAFSNSLGVGSFSLSQSGNNLVLNFSPVPEPSTYALLLFGVGALGLRAWRRRRAD